MGLFSWLFPSDDDRVAKARRLLDAGRWVDARDEVAGVDRDDAREIVAEADRGLVRANLDAAISWGEAGDDERVRMHLELAEQFHPGGMEDALRAARREIREQRRLRREEEEAARREKEARLLSVDPLGLTGGRTLLDAVPDGDPAAPDHEETAARLALLLEAYPEALQGDLDDLGTPFARAVLDLDDGRPDLALPALLELPDTAPLVRWERARAAYALGDAGAAVKELRAFAARAGGHASIGPWHTGVLLAQYTAETGDLQAALRVLRDVRATDPKAGGPLFAQLLEATGALAEAEAVLRGLIAEHPRSDGLYRLLARVRVRGGHREQAMAALERAMSHVCDTPGRCGYKPPNRGVVRDLAILYLEGAHDRERGLELAAQAGQLQVEQPEWADAYLEALVARATGAPAGDVLEVLWERTPAGPDRERLERYLPRDAA